MPTGEYRIEPIRQLCPHRPTTMPLFYDKGFHENQIEKPRDTLAFFEKPSFFVEKQRFSEN